MENKSGRLAQVTRCLADHGINIRALTVADTTDFGILRIIVDQPDEAYRILKEMHFTVRENWVIAVEIVDRPGGLAGVLEVLGDSGVNLEYLYTTVKTASQDALVIFRVEDIDRAVSFLQDAGINVLAEEKVYSL